ncbi:fructosamine kinase family protein [Catalinimonas alkaloidigena]|nr:fructosamine kinase family protein [Catalinimonas alkaloidigena]
MMQAYLLSLLRDHLGTAVDWQGSESLAGGCINHASRVQTTRGTFFAKWNDHLPYPDMFVREAESLRELRKATATLAIPEVLVATSPENDHPAVLITEFLPSRSASADDHAQLGRGLAELHRHQQTQFGFYHDNYCGATRQDNRWHEDWIHFYGQQRIGHLVEAIRAKGGMTSEEASLYERLIGLLPQWIAHRPVPSLTHGDLWSGNYLFTTQGPALIDPASSYADRECDLALMAMFGGFSSRVWEVYQATWPLPSGWKERQPLYMLYHYLNHQYLFGGGYGAQALRIARSYL